MRKLIGAIVAMGVVVTTVAFVRQREAVSRRRPERKAVRVTMSRFRAYGDCTFGSGIRFRKTTARDYQAITVSCTGFRQQLAS